MSSLFSSKNAQFYGLQTFLLPESWRKLESDKLIVYLQERWMDWSGSTEHVPPLHLPPTLCRNLPDGSQIHDSV